MIFIAIPAFLPVVGLDTVPGVVVNCCSLLSLIIRVYPMRSQPSLPVSADKERPGGTGNVA